VLGIDAEEYRNPAALPPGRVLVIGNGQTGCQIGEELHGAGSDVFIACGRAPWAPRRPSGRDIVSWLKETTFFDVPLSALPSPTALSPMCRRPASAVAMTCITEPRRRWVCSSWVG
jgi:putative flavoprotein involved in K+ transport